MVVGTIARGVIPNSTVVRVQQTPVKATKQIVMLFKITAIAAKTKKLRASFRD